MSSFQEENKSKNSIFIQNIDYSAVKRCRRAGAARQNRKKADFDWLWGVAGCPRSGGVRKTLWGWSQGEPSPFKKKKIAVENFVHKNRMNPLTGAFQEIIFIVNKCSNEQKATKFPSFLLVGGRR